MSKVAALVGTLCGFLAPANAQVTSVPLNGTLDQGPDKDGKLFTRVDPSFSEVDFENQFVPDHPLARLYFSGFACGSVVMADFNGDGRNDLFFTGGPGENGLFLQTKTPWKFEDATGKAGIDGGQRWAAGAAAFDLEQDGDLDLIVCNYDSPLQLYVNDGKAGFTDRAAECGLTQRDAYLVPTVADYDRDGDLDLFLLSNQLYREGGRPPKPPITKNPDNTIRISDEFDRYYSLKKDPSGGFTVDDSGRPDLLLRNDSRPGQALPFFTDVTRESGLDEPGFGLSATWWDSNDDGWLDLQIGNDFNDPDRLYLNQRDGTFKDLAASAYPTSAWFSMGADVADIDNDGLDDLFCADMAFTTHYKQKIGMGQMGSGQEILERIRPLQVMRNHLFLNTGTGRFREAAQLAGVAKTDWTWGVKFQDYDLDGRPDLFIANGAIRSFNHSDYEGATPERLIGNTKWDLWKNTPPRPETNLAFRNLGEIQFESIAPAWGLDDTGVSHGIASGDLDGDGDPDLVVTNLGRKVSIYQNKSTAPRIVIDLNEPVTEGARVQLQTGKVKQSRSVRTSGGYHTTSPAALTFAAKAQSSAVIKWPDGTQQSIENLKPGNIYKIRKTENEPAPPRSKPTPIFGPPAAMKGVVHREKIFDDFSKQPLLPHKLSQLGPASAVADIDGDGDLDFFLGGSSGSPGTLFRNENKNLTPLRCESLIRDQQFEDAAAAFLDIDQDGDQDLFVGSGSYENEAGDPLLRDRLYLNDGIGNFIHSNLLPDLRDVASCVRPIVSDDQKGLMVFVGARVIPGAYPLGGKSRILAIANGQVKDVTEDLAPDLMDAGMVTDAIWADVNGDQKSDLLVVSEWGTPKIFLHQDGKLIDRTTSAGLADLSGWWTRISAADIDADGDLDFAIGNFGLNTKYHATPKKPALLYYGDFHADGKKDLVEAEFENEQLFPVRGKSCSTAAMPALAKKFKNFHSFALAELDDIYSLEEAAKFECKVLESGFLINDGTGKFEFRTMPRIAQISPIQGMIFADFTGNGSLDLVIAQNFLNPQFETGPYSGGTGVLLKNDGKGNFAPVSTSESGILLPGDPRRLHLIKLDGNETSHLVCPLNNGPVLWQKLRKNVD